MSADTTQPGIFIAGTAVVLGPGDTLVIASSEPFNDEEVNGALGALGLQGRVLLIAGGDVQLAAVPAKKCSGGCKGCKT